MSEEEPSESAPRHKGRVPRRRLLTQRVVIGLAVLAVVATTAFAIAYKRLEGNINSVSIGEQLGPDRPEAVEVEGPQEPLNVLVMGSDNRDGTNIGGETPGLSDTTILLHLSADRSRAFGVSLPRDAMVERPECVGKDGEGTVPGGLTQFNAAYAVGGPACTVKTVEQLTNIRIDHFVVVDFAGFKDMVNAINGVTICVPEEVNDTIGKIRLPAGTYKVNGAQALDYVRVRHGIGAPTGDIGRMKRQQAFIAAMIEKVVSKGTLANPVRLYNFLDAATGSLTTDPGFANLKELASLGSSLKNIGLENISFVTVPNEPWAEDPNRLVWSAEAKGLWRRIRFDKPLGKFEADALGPGRKPTDAPPARAGEGSPDDAPNGSPDDSATGSPAGGDSAGEGSGSTPDEAAPTGSGTGAPTEEERIRAAEEAGLCT